MIRVENLTKIFIDGDREIAAISDLNLRCEEGRIRGLLGPNGAGKTTTLRIISSILKPTRGSVEIDGLDVTAQPEVIRKKIGFLTGTTGLYANLTARETFSYFGRLNGLGDRALKDRMEIVTDIFNMHDFLDRRIDRLSTGMRQ